MITSGKKRIRFYNRLFYRLYLRFSMLLTIFTILVGVIFIELYKESTMEIYVTQLNRRAVAIANQVSEYAVEDDVEGYLSYMEAVEAMEDSATTDIWVLSYYKAEEPLKRKFQNVNIQRKEMTSDMKKVVNKAFRDKITHSTSYDDIYGMVTLRLAAPIHDVGGNVIGAVLLNSDVGDQMEKMDQGRYLIVLSTLVALVVSAIIAVLFARQLSVPISRMRVTALKLAEGEYDEKTGVKRRDEIGNLASTIDVLSERLKENEEERRDMEQMRLDFFANVSHELRTPITVLRGYTETLADGYVADEEEQKKHFSRMLVECKNMERLVEDLLLLSKMQNPDFLIEREPVLVSQVFEDIKRSVRVLADKKGIKIKIRADEDGFILGDYDRLRQMFFVVIDNAIKFSHDGGDIEIEVAAGDKVTVQVRDYGMGIEEEDIPHIFEKFYRSNLSMNKKGSGLGLVVAKDIATKHGGDIGVRSVLGEGTIFTFLFDRLEMTEEWL